MVVIEVNGFDIILRDNVVISGLFGISVRIKLLMVYVMM